MNEETIRKLLEKFGGTFIEYDQGAAEFNDDPGEILAEATCNHREGLTLVVETEDRPPEIPPVGSILDIDELIEDFSDAVINAEKTSVWIVAEAKRLGRNRKTGRYRVRIKCWRPKQ